MAKLFLPNYGGSYLVWGACVVFFQAVLLAGYVFAHQWITRASFAKYLKIHLLLLFLPFLFFPGRILFISHANPGLFLVLDVFWKLFLSVGPVFFALSTISLVTQTWLAQSSLSQRQNPYALYSISNLGSFAGLLSYPFLFEWNLTNTQQLNMWRIGYIILVLLNMLAYKLVKVPFLQQCGKTEHRPIDWPMVLKWFCLSSAGVVLFLSVTNVITYEIAPAPLLWVIPLSIYLLSFVLCFKNTPFMPAWIHRYILTIVGVSIVYYFISKMYVVFAAASIICFSVLLFFLCLYVQGQLIKHKPNHQEMTLFYVTISLGGFVGGLVTSWIVPLVSDNLIEFLLGLFLLALGARNRALIIMTIVAIAVSSPLENMIKNHKTVYKKRNYYGVYDVFESKGLRIMLHGTTLHGVQFQDAQQRWIPIGYYSPTSPLGDILIKNIFPTNRIGGVGLGAGTIAMYSRRDCPVDFYEIDPDVVSIAKNQFWYLSSAPGQVNILLGDARISLENQKDVHYDVLIIDAFGGDSIPMHLVNKDVGRLYKQRINPLGAVVFHIPSRFFDLKPILAHMANDLGAQVAFKQTMDEGFTLRTVWAVMTWDQSAYLKLITQNGWQVLDAKQYPHIRPWSDEYSTILPIVNWSQVTQSFNNLFQGIREHIIHPFFFRK